MPKIKNNVAAKKDFSNIFLIVILIGILYFCYLLFKPFLTEIIIAAILVTIFYPAYLKIVYWTKGKITLSSLIICILILLIIIVPFTCFVFYLAQQSLALYASISPGINNGLLSYLDVQVWQKLDFIEKDIFDVQQFVIDSISTIRGYVLAAASSVVRGTGQFFTSLLLVIFTMFFLFRDGRSLLRRLMHLTPLSNKYDKLIWMKFRDVSYTTIVATFATSLAQAITGAIGFMVVGLPGLLAGVLIFVFSFLPYIGTAFVWLPAAIYLLIIGKVWQAIFIFLWGLIIISLIDNLLRPYLIKDKAQVHPLIIFFSIFGGIVVLGVWGIIFGPLIVALAVTFLHIYELEFSKVLER